MATSRHLVLPGGHRVLVDVEDWPLVVGRSWHIANGYARAHRPRSEGGRMVYLHRLIVGTPPRVHTDHRNGDKLDNRRANLRVATYTENQVNRKRLNRNNRSGTRGVFRYGNRWRAEIKVNRRAIYLGRFDRLEDAAAARKQAELEYFGEVCP
jgi:hypothetical protein